MFLCDALSQDCELTWINHYKGTILFAVQTRHSDRGHMVAFCLCVTLTSSSREYLVFGAHSRVAVLAAEAVLCHASILLSLLPSAHMQPLASSYSRRVR